jgi:hypothetical protein
MKKCVLVFKQCKINTWQSKINDLAAMKLSNLKIGRGKKKKIIFDDKMETIVIPLLLVLQMHNTTMLHDQEKSNQFIFQRQVN